MSVLTTERKVLNLKILVVGDSGVGKTCFIYQFCDGKFYPNYVSTVGCDCRNVTTDVDGTRMQLQIWDTAGQERFRTLTSTYYRGASGIILMYDVTNEGSFNNITHWLENIVHNASQDVCKVLVGNKCDKNERQVDYRRAQTFADSYDMKLEEISAKKNQNLEQVFESLCTAIMEQRQQRLSHPEHVESAIKESQVKLSGKEKSKSWCGC
ncbi:uncharacterized protein [Antedon mediterranea]|uniref:uncharacterized protein n=1 Tax=Antedon mediterranea TaxID=105859 RepID=UPI003AF99B4A